MSYEVGPVTLDGMVTVLAQYDPAVRWNGWLSPSLDALGAVTVLETINALDPGDPGYWYDFVDEMLHVRDRTDEFAEIDSYEPDADGLYPLGECAWIWSADSVPPTARP
jgi:hypothetical protein